MADVIPFPDSKDRYWQGLERAIERTLLAGGVGAADARRLSAEIAKEHGEFVQNFLDQVKGKLFYPPAITQFQAEEIRAAISRVVQTAFNAQCETRILCEFKNRGFLPPDFKINAGHDVGTDNDTDPLT